MVGFTTLALWCFLHLEMVFAAEPPGGFYTTRYDHLDIENILNQKRLVHYYAACLLDKGPCTPQGIEFKNILPEAIKTNCLRCTEKQRVVTLRSVRRLRKEYPDIWAQLQTSWDPTGEYMKRLEASVNKPIPIPTTTTEFKNTPADELANRFEDQLDVKRTPDITTTRRAILTSTAPPVITSSSTTPSSTTLRLIISTLKPKATTQRFSTGSSFYRVTKRIISRPFSSIGPNLIVPNPKAIIDTVISTAGAVFNSVTNSVTNTVVTVFKG